MNSTIRDKFAKCITFESLLDNMVQPIHIVTADGIIQYVNPAWMNKYKLSEESVIGKNIRDISVLTESMNYYRSFSSNSAENAEKLSVKEENVPKTTPACIQAIQRKCDVSVVTQLPDGSQVVVKSTPIFDETGNICWVLTQVQDLSEMADWRDKLDEEVKRNTKLKRELDYLRSAANESALVGASPSMRNLRNLISIVSKTDASVLITGESGVGKEVVAREIYKQSVRNDKPFVTINCAALPENLLESELFGYEKGAFTGAFKNKLGLFEIADGGTLFMDEVGELPLQLQPKLLRALQEHEIRRVGGSKNIPINVRIIAATNQKLETRVKDGKFRSDLYYRLNVVPIAIPALRERKEDIALLATHFLQKCNAKYGSEKFFMDEAIPVLEQYEWPGNVRELANIVERVVIFSNNNAITPHQVSVALHGIIDVADSNSQGAAPFESLTKAVEDLECRMIGDAVRCCSSTYKAAKFLGISQSTLVRKAKQYGIDTSRHN